MTAAKRLLAALLAPRCPLCRERHRLLHDHLRFDHYGEDQ